jgi:hypothetical protein
MDLKIEKRICPYSGIEFVPKRTNQVYAYAKYREDYNNKKNNEKRKVLNEFNKPLKKCFEILLNILNGQKEKIVHKEYLRGAGFNFSVFTHFHMDKDIKKACYALYHVHYYKLDDNYYKILKND